jgi:hypothetical protein
MAHLICKKTGYNCFNHSFQLGLEISLKKNLFALLAISSCVSLSLLTTDGAQAASSLSQTADSAVSFSGKPTFSLNLVNSSLNWTGQPQQSNPKNSSSCRKTQNLKQ